MVINFWTSFLFTAMQRGIVVANRSFMPAGHRKFIQYVEVGNQFFFTNINHRFFRKLWPRMTMTIRCSIAFIRILSFLQRWKPSRTWGASTLIWWDEFGWFLFWTVTHNLILGDFNRFKDIWILGDSLRHYPNEERLWGICIFFIYSGMGNLWTTCLHWWMGDLKKVSKCRNGRNSSSSSIFFSGTCLPGKDASRFHKIVPRCVHRSWAVRMKF